MFVEANFILIFFSFEASVIETNLVTYKKNALEEIEGL